MRHLYTFKLTFDQELISILALYVFKQMTPGTGGRFDGFLK